MSEFSYHPAYITSEDFHAALATYDEHIDEISKASKATTASLAALDKYLFGELQANLKRRAASGEAFYEYDEVAKCIEWKLKHGKFRPNLLNLAKSNTPEGVKEMSAVALGKLPATNKPAPTLIMECINDMSRLRGIGPASASLLLSIACPNYVPFFSDEAYRWATTTTAKGDPWKRPIKYNKQEYLAYVAAVDKIAGRLKVKASEVERVGWVLGKDGSDISAPSDSSDNSDE